MNSNYGKSNKSAPLNNFAFDFGLDSNRSRSLNDQKNPSSYSSSSFSSTQPKPNTASSGPSWQPNRPSWVHQPAPSQSIQPGALSGPSSMVGDIFGKSWGSPAPPTTASGIGIVNKNPNLFGDLVSSAIGQNKGGTNVPLKNATLSPATTSKNKSPYSTGNLADSLPKTGNPVKTSSNWGSSESFGSFTSGYSNSNSGNGNSTNSVKSGGSSMRNLGGRGGGGGGMKSNTDPFGSLLDLGTKSATSMNSATKGNNKSSSGDDAFGDFLNASKSSTPAFPSTASANKSTSADSNNGSHSKINDFGIPTSQNQPPMQSSGVDAFDMLFPSSGASSGVASSQSEGLGNQQFSGADDWGTEFGGGEDTATTTEIEGLPPPPSGVSASAAKNKGMDNYKQGQYADAIKWLSWAVILLEKAGDDDATMEVLSSRASCYKEVGEYKKAVADCTKVLEHNSSNVPVLVQRALLYESMEKYKLGAEDLKTVMKIDPGNRVARSTVHRLTKMAS